MTSISSLRPPIQTHTLAPPTPTRTAAGPLVSTSHALPSSPNAHALAQTFGDRQNVHALAQVLRNIAAGLAEDASPAEVLTHMKMWSLNIHPDSSYRPANSVGRVKTAKVEDFIRSKDFATPQTKGHLTSIAQSIDVYLREHPLGNFGGALSWPFPLNAKQQTQIYESFAKNPANLSEVQHYNGDKGALGYLMNGLEFSGEALQNPVKALEKIVVSPKAQALGQSIQRQLGGVATPTSVADYVLTAIHLSLDPAAITQPSRTRVAGFDMAHSDYWGKPASAMVNGLGTHLQERSGLSSDVAKLATHILLARAAPQYLVKDIPDTVTQGSQAWASFCLNVAKIEAESPGTVTSMSYTQVMLAAKTSGQMPPDYAQKAVLVDWAVANGVIEHKDNDLYTPEQIQTAQTHFNEQQDERIEASGLLNVEIPSRRDIALAKLKQKFGDNIPFERKILEPTVPREPLDGYHSMLDIAMMGLSDVKWKSSDPSIPVTAINKDPGLGVTPIFNSQFEEAINAKKKGLNTTVKHLIAQLPLADRNNFEHGELSFFQQSTYKLKAYPTNGDLIDKDNGLFIKTKSGNDISIYKIDIKNGNIEKQNRADMGVNKYRFINMETRTTEFKPSDYSEEKQKSTRRPPSAIPASFSSDRSQYIAQAFVEHLDLDNADILKQAKGVTTLDRHLEIQDKFTDFCLNLIPLRSAIKNFIDGNHVEGAMDLTMDIFSFLTAGAAAVTKLAKLGVTTASAAVKALQAAKIIGVSTLSVLNPLDGLGDAGKSALSLASKGVNKLRGATGSYDLVEASRRYGVSATGTFKFADQRIEGGAILHNSKWYAYDPIKAQPYGTPLDGFIPKTGAVDGEPLHGFSDWVYKKLNGDPSLSTQETPSVGRFVPKEFKDALEAARRPKNLMDFEFGYASGNPERIPGYSANMNIFELQALASQRFLSPEDVGALVKKIEQKKVMLTQEGVTLFQKDIQAAGGTVTPISQEYYLSQINLTSPGECAGMANTLGFALESGTESTFLGNLFKAAAKPKDATSMAFIKNLNSLQNAVEGAETFHMGKPIRQLPYQEIISELTSSASPKMLRIATRDHALLAGTVLRDNKPVWFYFDPNYGLAKFDSAEAMKNGLERTLNKGTNPHQLRSHGNTPGSPEYKVSEFSAGDIASYPHSTDVIRMAIVEL